MCAFWLDTIVETNLRFALNVLSDFETLLNRTDEYF